MEVGEGGGLDGEAGADDVEGVGEGHGGYAGGSAAEETAGGGERFVRGGFEELVVVKCVSSSRLCIAQQENLQLARLLSSDRRGQVNVSLPVCRNCNSQTAQHYTARCVYNSCHSLPSCL